MFPMDLHLYPADNRVLVSFTSYQERVNFGSVLKTSVQDLETPLLQSRWGAIGLWQRTHGTCVAHLSRQEQAQEKEKIMISQLSDRADSQWHTAPLSSSVTQRPPHCSLSSLIAKYLLLAVDFCNLSERWKESGLWWRKQWEWKDLRLNRFGKMAIQALRLTFKLSHLHKKCQLWPCVPIAQI